jgi:oligosaccharide amylase
MTRHVVLGNGNILVCLDKNYRIRDFFYPYVGQENHVSGNQHRIGVWVNGKFSWVSKDDWDLSIKYKEDTLVSDVNAYSDKLKVKLTINETVHYEKNILIRKVSVENLTENKREIRVFFSQHFHISEANIGDTVYYNPELKSIVNYKGKRYFLIGGRVDGKDFTEYSTGVSGGITHKLGTYVDAEDGVLSKNPVEHGTVDSTIGFSVELEKNQSKEIDYWIAVGKNYREISELREFILKESPSKLIERVERHGRKWVHKTAIDFCSLDEDVVKLFKQSLLILRTQIDNRGAIIAANDTHTFRNKKDTYSYMWPRDGALVARSLDKSGHHNITRRFFEFCAHAACDEGYLMHKYRPDGSLGSSWHSWMKDGNLQLPIQEDETALVLDALWKNYEDSKDDRLIKGSAKEFIKKAGDFLVNFRDKKTNLPKESYDLWEEKLGVHTFTCATVYAGLMAAKNFAENFGKKTDAARYAKAAVEVREATIKYMYDEETKIFIKGIRYDNSGKMQFDKTIDSSTVYGLFEYEILNINDPRLTRTVDKMLEKLWNRTGCGGVCRYEGDQYYRYPNTTENPWFVCTMWLAEYYVAKAKNLDELEKAEELLHWVVTYALPPGTLSEQINSGTCEPLSVAPLTWSHAGFIIAVVKYLDKYKELKK